MLERSKRDVNRRCSFGSGVRVRLVNGHLRSRALETFKARVLELCQKVLAPSNSDISIERIHGGGFNKVIGISVTSSESPTISQYITRVPRFEVA